jgi:type IV pilus assembly protein PilQ
MKKIHILLLFLCCAMISSHAISQSGKDARLRMKGYVNPQEIVSLDSTMRMDQALLVIGELSKQFAGKIIVDLEKRKNPIGVYVVNQHWRDALEMILTRNGLTYEEQPEFIRLMPMGSQVEGLSRGGEKLSGEPPPTLQSRDVKISAVFFTTNVEKLQNFGISWDFFRSKAKEPGISGYMSAGIVRGDTLSNIPPTSQSPSLKKALAVISSPPEFKFANIDALVKFFGSNQLGEVITSPEVVVRAGKKGKIQVGKNIFITTRDIGGNSVASQVQTGTIIDVTPTVYTQSDTDFVDLDLSIEQSDASVGQTGPEIAKTLVTTRTLLFDGEESVIGGLYTTTESESREGIPFLKDLPPWFLGLRYLFGSESKIKSKNELIVLLKAELLRPIRDRISTRETEQQIIDAKRKEFQKEFDKK